MRTLIAGWFSFPQMGATAGDLLSRDVLCRWLDEAGLAYDVATAPPFEGGIDWRSADPRDYSHVIFICGPFGRGEPVNDFLTHFRGRKFIGLNLSMLESLDDWNPFDLLIERDSSRTAHPDLVFLSSPAVEPAGSGGGAVPVVGVILVHPQKEYKKGAMHAVANAAIHRLTSVREMARLYIDTALEPWNTSGLRSPGEIEATIAKMDLVVTTRLHGMVLALKNGVPAVVIDPIAGGAKIRRQAETIGWPTVFTADEVTDEKLSAAFDDSRSEQARRTARECQSRAAGQLRHVRGELLRAMHYPAF